MALEHALAQRNLDYATMHVPISLLGSITPRTDRTRLRQRDASRLEPNELQRQRDGASITTGEQGVSAPVILVVDDEPSFLRLMDIFLTTHRYTAVPCPAARNAVAMAHQYQPELIMLDLHMPLIDDGRWVLSELQRDPVTRSIPVVVISADPRGLQKHSAELKSGSVAQLVKPFDLEQFLLVLKMAMDGPDQPASTDAPATRPSAGGTAKRTEPPTSTTTHSLIAGNRYRLPNGREFIAAVDGNHYLLRTLAEWRKDAPAACIVRPDGRITLHGFDTGWRVGDLQHDGPAPEREQQDE